MSMEIQFSRLDEVAERSQAVSRLEGRNYPVRIPNVLICNEECPTQCALRRDLSNSILWRCTSGQ